MDEVRELYAAGFALVKSPRTPGRPGSLTNKRAMMKKLMILLMLMTWQVAYPADSAKQPSESPPDKNPDCMNRTTNSATGDCIVQDKGKPHHLHPPKQPITTTVPGPTIPRSPSAPAAGDSAKDNAK